MLQPLITVIVPVYKVEDCLERCVSSIRNQTYTNLEIVLVDDGSPDRSGELCDTLAKQDARIRVIHKENGGLSSARNAGLNIAKGEYVGFVDSDDWVDKEMYETLYALLTENDAQIAACGLQCDYADGKTSWFNPKYPGENKTELFLTQDALREVTYSEKITNSACDKLFSKSILDGLPMKEGIIFEDTQVMPFWLERASRVVYTPAPYYHYVMTESSITRGGIKARHFALADVHWERFYYYQDKHPQLASYAALSCVLTALGLIHASTNSADCTDLRKQLIRKTRSIDPKLFFALLSCKEKVKYCLFRVHPNLYTRIIDIYAYIRTRKVHAE